MKNLSFSEIIWICILSLYYQKLFSKAFWCNFLECNFFMLANLNQHSLSFRMRMKMKILNFCHYRGQVESLGALGPSWTIIWDLELYFCIIIWKTDTYLVGSSFKIMDAPGPLQRNVIPVSRLLLLSNLPGGTFQNLVGTILKVAFFQKVQFIFQISQSPKKYSKKLSWT